jgi:thiamine pyridinylase
MAGSWARKGSLGEGYQPPPPPASDDSTLNVALYPYVPSPGAFVSAVQMMWSQVCPGVTLNFEPYDPYHGPPPSTLDVFAFDCIYVDDLVAAGQVDPIAATEIDALDDVMDFARGNAAISTDEKAFAGIPYLGCTAVLYYRTGDSPFEAPGQLGIDELRQILGNATYKGPKPPLGEGLLMDLGGKTTDACNYAAMWRTLYSTWWPKPVPMEGSLDSDVFGELGEYAVIAGREQALYEDPGNERTDWFAAGSGRALAGLTETMSAWSPEMLSKIRFLPLPSARGDAVKPISYYADAVGLRPGLADRRETAVKLANVIASAKVSLAALAPRRNT